MIVDNASVNVGVQISGSLLSVLLSVYPEVELMDHTVNVGLIFGGTAVWFSTATAPFYIPTGGDRGS